MTFRALILLLLLAGCLPANDQELVVQNPSVRFVLWQTAPETYVGAVYSSQPAVIRHLTVQAEGLTSDDATCAPWEVLPGALRCAAGVPIRASPGGYRINLESREPPVGTACIVQGEVVELLLCNDMIPLATQ